MEESVRVRLRIEKLGNWAYRFMLVLGLLLPLSIIVWLSYLAIPFGSLSLVDADEQFKYCVDFSTVTSICFHFSVISGDIAHDCFLASIVSTFYFICCVAIYWNLFSLFKQLKKGLIFSERNIKSANKVFNWVFALVIGKAVLDSIIWFLYKDDAPVKIDFIGDIFFYAFGFTIFALFNYLLRFGAALKAENELTI